MPEPRAEVVATPTEFHGGPDGGWEPRVDFSVNSNPFGPPAALLELLRSVDVSRYPDPTGWTARVRAAELNRTGAERVLLGAGSAELIQRVAACYLRPGDRVVVAAPTFAEYARACRLHGATVVFAHPYGDPYGDPSGYPPAYSATYPPFGRSGDSSAMAQPNPEPLLRAISAAAPTLVWLCQPNNPTGHGWSAESLERLAEACRIADALLVIDLAYRELSSGADPAAPMPAAPVPPAPVPPAPSCLTLHSITKSFTVPGLRAGYACGPAGVIAALEAAAPPWVTGAHAQAALGWACSDAGGEFLRRTVPKLLELREALTAGLAAAGHAPVPSQTTFFLLQTGEGAAEMCRRAREAGFRLRDCSSFGLPHHVRLATRSESDNSRLLRWLGS